MTDRLADYYDLIICDLDGVVYVGQRAVTGAPQVLAGLAEAGKPVAYATNNASRRADQVVDLLKKVDVNAEAGQVFTSGQAAARRLAARLPAGASVLVVGTSALAAEVAAVGLSPVAEANAATEAVIQGYGPQIGWADLAEASVAIRGGAWWVVTNADRTLPSPRGPLPGNGSLMSVLVTALDRQPDEIVGKPQPALFELAARSNGAQRPLVVGDRLDTDVEGARLAGFDSLLVLTGVATARDALAAAPSQRPTHLSADLSGVGAPEQTVRVPAGVGASGVQVGGWRVDLDGDRLVLSGQDEPDRALPALAAVAWSRPDWSCCAGDTAAAEHALQALGLDGVTFTATYASSADPRSRPVPTPAPTPTLRRS